jgi:putative phosphoribosyl transferase
MIFADRKAAGQALARELRTIPGLGDGVVLALPRGGVPLGLEIARKLQLPLDIFVVRKLGVPGEEELAMGAIAGSGMVVLDPQIVRAFGIRQDVIEAVIARERAVIERRERIYRSGSPAVPLTHRTVILVDDGIATGSTMKAAIQAVRAQASHIVVAVPVAARASADEVRTRADRFVCLLCPQHFHAVGEYYSNFEQLTDDEVIAMLPQSQR